MIMQEVIRFLGRGAEKKPCFDGGRGRCSNLSPDLSASL